MLLSTPNIQQIEFTQGDDDIDLTFLATDDSNNPQDLTGASIAVEMLAPNGQGIVTFPNGQITIPDQTANPGQFVLNLANSGADTTSVGEGANKQVFAQIIIGGVTQTYRGNNLLTVYPPTPNQ